MAETVNHPPHYNQGTIECIDVIEMLALNFNRGSALKYLWRAGHKGDELDDLRKAAWYLSREIRRIEIERGERVRVK